jgi:hypothetical protein
MTRKDSSPLAWGGSQETGPDCDELQAIRCKIKALYTSMLVDGGSVAIHPEGAMKRGMDDL